MKTLNDLLLEVKTEKERFDELITLMPQLLDNKKVYYSGDKYIYYDGEKLYSGIDIYPKDNIVSGSFPYIFFLSSFYSAKNFAEKYKTIKTLKADKKFQVNEFGLITMKDFGVVSDSTFIKNILSKYQEHIEEELLKKEA